MSSKATDWQATLACIHGDAARRGVAPAPLHLVRLIAKSSTMRFQTVHRLTKYFHQNHRRSIRHLILRFIYWRMTVRYAWEIPLGTEIGPGVMLRHMGPIVVHQDTVFGRNVNLNTGVVIGHTPRGPHAGVPRFGNNVYVGPGAKVIGGITIGNDVAIGANAVVTRDVPDHSVVAGIPARIISTDGAAGYVNNPC